MPDSILGLPIHPLLVHATVVIVPLAAASVGLAALNRRFRSWAGPLPLALAVISVILAPLSTSSGESLRNDLGVSPLIEHHEELGKTLLWFVLALAVVAAAQYFLNRTGSGGRAMVSVVAVACVLAAGATLVDVALIGHSGAKAAWSGVVNQQPASANSGDDGG